MQVGLVDLGRKVIQVNMAEERMGSQVMSDFQDLKDYQVKQASQVVQERLAGQELQVQGEKMDLVDLKVMLDE